ncbi:MAG TPA: ABC transporter substrate-binding protein, partial [Pyrinomonadaceae bacterium]|nr:ABC transporter substrate-binding protein [Pyrinomonadaceae bacterium]
LTSAASDAAAERVRGLMFNSLVRKNEKFEYVGELAKEIQTSEDGKTITFVLQDNVKFHNGKDFTSADVKYTFAELFKSPTAFKAGSFFETVNDQKVPHIVSLEAPDPKTVVFTVSRPALKNKLLSNLVAVPIIAQGTVEQQKTQPIGTGAFKFVNFDQSQNTVELEANPNYWEGAPKVQKVRIKTVTDANSLQAELQSGGIDIAPLANNLPPDALNSLGKLPNLKVEKFNGSNIDYLGFNTQSTSLDKVKIRQAIAYGIDRERIINELLSGQAIIAHSVLPTDSWAYNGETKYSYNPAKAKQLVAESGYKNESIKFRFSVGNTAVNQYAQVIQNSLKEIGLNVEIETVEPNTLRQQLALGQFQMNTGRWIGGNQDPIFLNDLFATGAIPGGKVTCCNRSRYSNPEFDKIIDQALNATDRETATQLYLKAQEIVSNDLPMLPLWYPANMVVSNKRIGNVKINSSGDWNFIKDVTVEGK